MINAKEAERIGLVTMVVPHEELENTTWELEEKLVKGKEKLVEEKNQNKINSGHYHEYLDRASIALDYIYQFIRCHPLNKRELKLAKQCEKAESELAKLYKLAGDLLEDKKNKK